MTLAREAIRVADVLLKNLYGLTPLRKAPPNPLHPAGYDVIVLELLKQLSAAMDPSAKKRLKGFIAAVEAHPNPRLIDAAAKKWLTISTDQAAVVVPLLKNVGPAIVLATKMAAQTDLGLKIVPSLDAVDRHVVDFAAQSQAHFIRDEYGRRSVAYSQVARDVVSQGVEAGLDRYAIGKLLAERLTGTDAARSESYWRMIASVFTARSRSYGTLKGFSEAGIERYQFHAVLDEVTSEICRFMHGKVFTTLPALARFEAKLTDPEDIKDAQPWASVGKTDDGDAALFYKKGGERHLIARVNESGVGQKDGVGSYSHGMSSSALSAAGMSAPPLHGHCRSVLLPT